MKRPIIVSDCKDQKVIRWLRKLGYDVVPWGPQRVLWFWMV